MMGAAYILLAVGAVYNLLLFVLMFQKIMVLEKWNWLYRDVAVPLLASGSSVGLLKAFWSIEEGVIGLFTVLTLAGTLSLSASILTAPYVRDQIFFFMRKFKTEFTT